jgi:putative endonuclease
MHEQWEHKHRVTRGFTSKYNLNRLVYYAEFAEVNEAIAYEKRIKGWVRRKKDALIQESNPNWSDLAGDWYSSTAGDSSAA